MTTEEKIKKHLENYRSKHKKNQKEMADIIGISYATYQELEKGIVKTSKTLKKLKETTGFNEKNVYSTGFGGEEIVKLRREIIELQSSVNVLLAEVSKLSAKNDRKNFETRFGELDKEIESEYERLYKEYLKEQEQGQQDK